jgi:ribosomal protein L32
MLFKGKGFSSLFKRNRYNNLQQNEREKYLKELEKHRVRRIDHIKLDSKYRKPIIRKCPNCRMLLPHFVKKCPNCGEVILS